MKLKNKIKYGLAIIGFLLCVFSGYWYLGLHKDISQFLAFEFIGLGAILVAFFISELDHYANDLKDFRKQLRYIEEKVHDELKLIKKLRGVK